MTTDTLIYEGHGWKVVAPASAPTGLHIVSVGVGLDKDAALELANAILDWAKE
ncbi:MAG TPA: hypothetical protein VJN62_02295 [Gemmatimonadales bacterium]|nr:hypothetical protein [Gemmatimonadales bacterium]